MARSLKLFAALIFLSAMLVPAASAQSNVRIVRISDVEGQVDFDNGNGYESATVNVPITEGVRLATRDDGWAEVQFEDGSTLRLAPNSEIVFSELKFSGDGAALTSVDMAQGEAEFEIAYQDRGSFQVNAQQKSILLHQSGRFRVRTDNSNPLELVVWKGEVGIFDSGSGEEVSVVNNETFVLDPGDLSRYDLEKGAAGDDLDQWSTQRDDYLSKAARNNDGQTQSPYKYGDSDLDSDGQYYDVPDYGSLWRPNGVALDWDPFSNGYWCQSPFGFTWVSAYRWGWMPYRYGRWIFVNGRGWFWEPGGWHGWNHIPPVFNAPPRFRRPSPPPPGVVPNHIGGGPGPIKPPDHKTYVRRMGPPDQRTGNPPQSTPAPGQRIFPRRMGPPEDQRAGNPPQAPPGPDTRISPRRVGPPEDQRAGSPPQSTPGPETRIVPGRIMPPEDRRRVDPPQPGPAQVRRDNPPQPQPGPVKSYSPPQQQPPTPAPVRSYTPPPQPTPAPVKTYTPPPEPPVRSYSPPPQPPARSYSPPPPAPVSHQETHSAPAQSHSESHSDSKDSSKPKR
jgi:hypothetical protein